MKLLLLDSMKTSGNYNLLSEFEKNTQQSLEEKKKRIAELEVLLYEKNNHIAALESTQKHITEQYNELADFAGRLQEELRKARYLY